MTERDEKPDRFDFFRQLKDLGRQNVSYWTSSLPPFAAALAKWNLEMMRFSAKRSLEYRELSSRISQCRTPMEIWGEQRRFFEHMQQEYTQEMHRLLELVGDMPGVQTPSESRAGTADSPTETAQPGTSESPAQSMVTESAEKMAGAATAAAQQVADDARAAKEQLDETAPGAHEARAAIDAAEAAASTIARQAEATASLVAGSAAAVGAGVMDQAAGTDNASDVGVSDHDETEGDDADEAASVIAESTPAYTSDDSEDDVGTDTPEDDSQTAGAVIAEPGPEPDEDSDDDGTASDGEIERSGSAAAPDALETSTPPESEHDPAEPSDDPAKE